VLAVSNSIQSGVAKEEVLYSSKSSKPFTLEHPKNILLLTFILTLFMAIVFLVLYMVLMWKNISLRDNLVILLAICVNLLLEVVLIGIVVRMYQIDDWYLLEYIDSNLTSKDTTIVRQQFRLEDNSKMLLYSFRPTKNIQIPSN
jgi:hypothetical protein